MENYIDDNLDDDCNLLYSSALSVIELFTLKNREYFKLDTDNIKNVRKIKRKEQEIDLIINNIKKKYSFLENIKKCKNKTHSELAFELDHIFEDNKRMINSYTREKTFKTKIIEKFDEIEIQAYSEDESKENKLRHLSSKDVKDFELNKLYNNRKSSNEINNPFDDIEYNKGDKNNQKIEYNIKKNNSIKKDLDDYLNNPNLDSVNNNELIDNNKIPNEKESEQMKYIQANALGEIDLFALEEMLENSKEYKGDEEFRKNLINLKNQIQELSLGLETEITQTNEKLDMISDDIKIAEINVDDINKNLKEAAIEKNKFNKAKYPLIFGGIGSTLGIIVPGVGSIIGGSIGSVLGYYLSRLEKKQIEKISSKDRKK